MHLRGYKAPAIENFGSTHDQFDTVDLTDNEIRKLDGFPLLKRLKHIILTDNKIIRIAEDLTFQVPNLETLILSGNNFAELKDLDPLSLCKNLTFLTLAQCPVALKPNYRLYVVFRIPNVSLLMSVLVSYFFIK
ncbi:unnamed protein product [Protopolystoma xenopodis]|uniref:U2A'/phosphoprotein 32 family A C-terminal domain-containing protein n=1 Tax=Protopolystoma xenopodis TaxID=117903 RepID=A0A3S5CF31_9PLAT|nr:unnamed protein product [Protopolystoma xenopodis]